MIPRYALLELWQALGGDWQTFEEWMAEPRRTEADAWSQLLGAVRGSVASLFADTNPPAGQLLDLVRWQDVEET